MTRHCCHTQQEAGGRLAPQEWGREHIGRNGKAKIRYAMDIGVHINVDLGIELADRDFSRHGSVAARRHVGMIVDRRERPSGLLWCRGQAAEKTRYPKLTPPSSAKHISVEHAIGTKASDTAARRT